MSVVAFPVREHPTANQPKKDLYEIGEIPPLGHVPKNMYAWVIRRDRHGPPEQSMQLEVVPTHTIGEDEVLVLVMAAGVNYNGVWAGLGLPISPFDVHKQPFHIAGSDASGIVWAVGAKVKRWKVGDEVVIHCNQDDGDDEECNGGDPMFSTSQRIWGYETPDGSFAQFCKVQARQLMKRAQHLTWEESASYTLTLATAYRMLFGHRPHILRPGHNVLVWGAAGGIGSMAVQLIATAGANAIGVISDPSKTRLRDAARRQGRHQPQRLRLLGPAARRRRPEGLCRVHEEGAQVRRGDLGDHRQGQRRRLRLRASRRADLPGVVQHREARRHGGVLRRHHRLQPHHGRPLRVDAPEAHPGQPLRQPAAGEPGQPARDRAPHRSLHERGLRLGRHPKAHTKMWKNQHKPGNMAVLVSAKRPGLRTLEDALDD